MTFPLDLSRSLEPEEMEDIMGHPAVLAISERVVRQPEVGYQVADAMLHIFSALEGHNPLVALLAALKVAGVLAANADDEVERIWRRRNFKVIEGGGGIAGSAS